MPSSRIGSLVFSSVVSKTVNRKKGANKLTFRSQRSALRAHLPPLPWLIPCHRTSVWKWMALLPFASFRTCPLSSSSTSRQDVSDDANSFNFLRLLILPLPKQSLTPCQSRPCLSAQLQCISSPANPNPTSAPSTSSKCPSHRPLPHPAPSEMLELVPAWGDGTFRTSLVCLALKAGAERISSVALWAPFQMDCLDCPCSFTCFSSTPLRPVPPVPCSEVFTSTATGLGGGGGGKAGKMSLRDGSFGGEVEATGEASFSRIRVIRVIRDVRVVRQIQIQGALLRPLGPQKLLELFDACTQRFVRQPLPGKLDLKLFLLVDLHEARSLHAQNHAMLCFWLLLYDFVVFSVPKSKCNDDKLVLVNDMLTWTCLGHTFELFDWKICHW